MPPSSAPHPSPGPAPASGATTGPVQRLLLAGVLVFYVATGLVPGARKVWSAKGARDYATYHYAVQEAVAGGDPYDTAALGRRAQAEGTRRGVHPYFYPPPFLATMLWAAPFSLATGYRLFFVLNQLLLGATVWATRRWLGTGWLPVVAAAATLTPVADSNVMGQANVMVLLFVVLGLSRRDGKPLGLAAMLKMSPALYLAHWVAGRRWASVAMAVGVAVVTSLAVLPLVGLDHQWRFYTEILPGFGSGEYHGLRVPITLPGNHSIPDLFNQLWPGPDAHHLAPAARVGAQVVSLGLLGALGLVSWRAQRPAAAGGPRGGDALQDALLLGAFTVLLTLTPVYTYEHHLTMLFVPGAALFAALAQGRLGPRWWLVVGPAWFFVAWKLLWLRNVQDWLPPAHWLLQESKFFGAVALGVACVVASRRAVPATAAPPETREAQEARMAAHLARIQAEQQARQAEKHREKQAHQQSLFPVDIRARGPAAAPGPGPATGEE